MILAVYEPAPTPLIVRPDWGGDVFHEIEYVGVPPLTLIVADPSVDDGVDGFVELTSDLVNAVGCVIVTEVVPVQPLPSVTV